MARLIEEETKILDIPQELIEKEKITCQSMKNFTENFF